MALLHWILTFMGFSVVLTLAVLNPIQVAFVPWPGAAPLMVPVLVLIVVGVTWGFLWGAINTWINGHAHRSHTRALERRIRDLEDTTRPLGAGTHTTPEGPTQDQILALLPPKKPWWRVFR